MLALLELVRVWEGASMKSSVGTAPVRCGGPLEGQRRVLGRGGSCCRRAAAVMVMKAVMVKAW